MHGKRDLDDVHFGPLNRKGREEVGGSDEVALSHDGRAFRSEVSTKIVQS